MPIKRLWFRPFPSREWADQMQKEWFHHWIGRGLEPEKKFISRIEKSRCFNHTVKRILAIHAETEYG